MVKKKALISVDAFEWDLFGDLYPRQRSSLINEFIHSAVYNFSDEDNSVELDKRIKQKEVDLKILKHKQELIRNKEEALEKSGKKYDPALNKLKDINQNKGFVGRNQIRYQANKYNLNFEKLLRLCKDKGFKIVYSGNTEVKEVA